MTASRADWELKVLYAGSLDRLLHDDILPAFQARTGCSAKATAGGSRGLAQALREGCMAADVLLSAGSEVFEMELAGREDGPDVSWYLTFATNAMALAVGPEPQHARPLPAELTAEEAARLLTRGLRLGRSDPEGDPQGYRAVIVVQLLERVFGQAGLSAAALGEPGRSSQIVASDQLIPMLRRGDLDLALIYRSHAVEERLPFVDLPEAVNLGSAHLADQYAKAAYKCADGTVYRGRPITYAAASVGGRCLSSAAGAFLAFLGSREVGDALRKHGFEQVCHLEVPSVDRHRREAGRVRPGARPSSAT